MPLKRSDREVMVRSVVGAAAMVYLFLSIVNFGLGIARDWFCLIDAMFMLPVSAVCFVLFISGQPKKPDSEDWS